MVGLGVGPGRGGHGPRSRGPDRLALIAVLAAMACTGGEPADFVRRDSAGVVITESFAPLWEAGAGWTVDSAPLLDLAATGTGAAHEFFDVRDARRTADGTMVVADDGAHEIRFFSSDGTALEQLGREGEGPGEFAWLANLAVLPGDSLMAYDYRLSRITVIGPDRSVARTLRVGGSQPPRPVLPLAEGYVGLSFSYEGFGEEIGLDRMPSPVLRIDADGEVVDTLTVIPGWEHVRHSRGDAWAIWARQAHIAVHDGRVYLGDPDSLAYEVRGPDGTLLRRVRVPGFDLALSDAEMEAERRSYMPDPAEASERMRGIMDAQPDRRTRPAYSQMLVDSAGYVWLEVHLGRHEERDSVSWRVFDPDGVWLGTVRTRPRFRAFHIGTDWILGRWRDSLDVDHVQLLHLDRSTAPDS